MDKAPPAIFTKFIGQELKWFWYDQRIIADGPMGPFPTRSDAETDWEAAHMIEGCRQDLHALNIAVEMPVLNMSLNQADIDLFIDIENTKRAIAAL